MTYLSPADRARSAAPRGSLMKTPDYLEALITKDLKPFNWQKTVEQVELIKKIAEREKAFNEEMAFEKVRLSHERRRREKLAQIEALMTRHKAQAKAVPVAETEPEIEEEQELVHINNPNRTKLLMALFCRIVGASSERLISPERSATIAGPRQIFMWFMYRNTPKSLPAIGRVLGGRDHSTILHGVRKINSDPFLLEKARAIEKELLFLELEISRNG